MIVKRTQFFLLSVVLVVVLGRAEAKILPSLLASFNKLTPTQKELSNGSLSHLSKNFRDDGLKRSPEPIKISKSLLSAPDSDVPEDRQLGAAENYAAIDIDFETTEIKDVLSFIEYKMNEITSLVQECIEQEYSADVSADVSKIRHECVGSTYQIIFFNYNEGLKKVKEVLMEILKLKLQNLKEDYEDETNFFLDVLESLVNKDFTIPKSLELAKKASKYYVSPRYFDRLVSITNPEVQAFTTLHERLKEQRSKIQNQLRQKEANEEEFIDAIERKARRLKHRTAAARRMRSVAHHRASKHRKLHGYHSGGKGQPGTNFAQPPRMTPQQATENAYLNKVESQLDNFSLYQNPALPTRGLSNFSPMFPPAQSGPKGFLIKKL
jgi:hypothetical protein